jgi:integrase
MTLGSYPAVSLADARQKAIDARKLIGQHKDPIEEGKQIQDVLDANAKGTFGRLLDLYVSYLRAEKRISADNVEKVLNRYVTDDMRDLSASHVSRHTVMDLMESVTANAKERGRTGKRAADLLRSYISSAYEFAVKATTSAAWRRQADAFKTLDSNPARIVGKYQSQVVTGERHLSSEEVATLWNRIGTEALSLPFALYLKLSLALGGQRVQELLHAEWSEFDTREKVWAIPMARRKIRSKAKHREPHLVPLTDLSLNLLEQLRKLSGDSKYLFPGNAKKKSEDKPRGPDALNQAIKRFCIPYGKSKREPFKLFTGRDMRRTWKSLAGQVGLSKEIRDRIQGHAFSDVASQHYDRYDYWPEKRAAMEKWCRWLERLVSGEQEDNKVVELRAS